jgi:hypothetical protein
VPDAAKILASVPLRCVEIEAGGHEDESPKSMWSPRESRRANLDARHDNALIDDEGKPAMLAINNNCETPASGISVLI